ncbi:taxadiene 5-alpha hydroxylase [Gossypium australe]|uniref:Taxadiene 5-alpha hydroxylase n=1 Tax=Gossypium australe TaxID=47621 RepID=A0A5B6WRH7_9ROSI|nr:taxadiene 5-alpha hydroxylase [Gossypium australe]
MLWCCTLEFEGSWEKIFTSSIKIILFKALYERKCRTPLYWPELSEFKIVGSDSIRETKDKVCVIRDCLKVASDCHFPYSEKLVTNLAREVK